ncbi:MAG: hypothetical protein AAF228_07935 [Pseudomonadota bacterium]
MAKIRPGSREVNRIQEVEHYQKLPEPKVKEVQKLSPQERLERLDTLEKLIQKSPFVSLDMRPEYMELFKRSSIDQVTWELTQLYLAVESLMNTSGSEDSLIYENGLKALEGHIRLHEYVHKGRAAIFEG